MNRWLRMTLLLAVTSAMVSPIQAALGKGTKPGEREHGAKAKIAKADAVKSAKRAPPADVSGAVALPAPAAPVEMNYPAPQIFRTHLYGYLDTQWRRLIDATGFPPPMKKGIENEFRESKGGIWLNANVMLQGSIDNRFRYFINLAAYRAGVISQPDEALAVRNAWIEVPLYRDYLNLRVGKTYRRFGLYNEILDAAPTFSGIEAPVYLVGGQVLLTRTTNVMLHGSWFHGDSRISYALMTGTDERKGDDVPIGADLRYQLADTLLVGSSFYWTGGPAKPTRTVGQGVPLGGVHDWMTSEDYKVYGGFGQLNLGGFEFQAEYWRAPHNGVRNPAEVLQLASSGALTPRQRQRFVNGKSNPTAADVNIDTSYVVQTFWAEATYTFPVGRGTLTPYVHFAWYSDPETVRGEPNGGNEAGPSDEGQFFRAVFGAVYRPISSVALKVELNPHFFTVMGKSAMLLPFQISLSYFWKLDIH